MPGMGQRWFYAGIGDVVSLTSVLISPRYFWFFIMILKPVGVPFLKTELELKVYVNPTLEVSFFYISGKFPFISCPMDTTGSMRISLQRECLSYLGQLSPQQVYSLEDFPSPPV